MSERREDGFVSIISTLFFMLLISVVTIGFVRIMISEQRQALDNDLSASALASARSGVEDGKRALLKYYDANTNAVTRAALASAFGSSECNALYGNATIADKLGLSSSGNVVNDAEFNQAYSCLKVSLTSPDYLAHASAGDSVVIPLSSVGEQYEYVQVYWHLLSSDVGADGDGTPGRYASSTAALYPLINASSPSDSWSGEGGMPAYLRVQLFGYPSGSFTRASLEDRNSSAIMVPAIVGAASFDLSVVDSDPNTFGSTLRNPVAVQCLPSPESNLGAYACNATIKVPVINIGETNYLKLTPLYGQTHFRVVLKNALGVALDMNEAQPIIDSTGRAADVYRRQQVRVRIGGMDNFPEYVTESAASICKKFQVSSSTVDFLTECPN